MEEATTQQGWIDAADARTSKLLRTTFPPNGPIAYTDLVKAAWKSFAYVQELRGTNAYSGDDVLACAEHYAYARVVVCAGGVFIFPYLVSGSLTYQAAKEVFEKVDLLQEFGRLISQGNGRVTPASLDQLNASIEGAKAGLALHYGSYVG